MPTVTQVSTLTALAPEIKEYYYKRLLENTEPKLVYAKYGDDYPLPEHTGTSFEWRKFTKLPKALTPLTEGVTPDGNNLNVTVVKGAIHQYGDWIRLSDIIKLAALDDLVIQATKLLGSQAGRTRDTIIREVVVGGTNVMYAPQADGTAVNSRANLTATCLMTPELLIQAATQLDALDNDGVDGGEDYVAIMHPYVAYDLMRHAEWKDWQKQQNGERLYDREVGRVGKVHVVTTSEAKISTGTGCPNGLAVFSTMVIAAHAYGKTELQGAGLEHIVKPLGYGEDPLNQRAAVGWKCTLAATRLNEEAMIRIESCSKYSATAQAN